MVITGLVLISSPQAAHLKVMPVPFPVNGNGSAGRNLFGFAVIEQLGVAVVSFQLALDLLHFPVEGSNKVAICILGHGMALAGQGGNVVGTGGGFLVFLLNRALVSGHAGRSKRSCRQRRALPRWYPWLRCLLPSGRHRPFSQVYTAV